MTSGFATSRGERDDRIRGGRAMSGHEVVSRVAVDRMVITGHRIECPLDWDRPHQAETISVFAREVVAAEKADDRGLPMICWYQGGPGMEFTFPASRGGWLEQLLTRYRVLLLDQRGTGLSTPLEAPALPRADPAELAAYLSHFRANSIVRDADASAPRCWGTAPAGTSSGRASAASAASPI